MSLGDEDENQPGLACGGGAELLNAWSKERTAGAGAPIVKPAMQPLSTRVPAVQQLAFAHTGGVGVGSSSVTLKMLAKCAKIRAKPML